MLELPAFAAEEQRLNDVVTQRLSNALLQLAVGGPAWDSIYEATRPEGSPFADVATTLQHSVSVCLPDAESVPAEGGVVYLTTGRWPLGRECRIVTPVEVDSTGWASFSVMPA